VFENRLVRIAYLSVFWNWTPVPCLHVLPLAPGSANGLRHLPEYNFELYLFLLETADYLIQVGYDHLTKVFIQLNIITRAQPYGVISVLLLSAAATAFFGDHVSSFLSLATYGPFTHLTQALHRQKK
jgi:hypothetical protein